MEEKSDKNQQYYRYQDDLFCIIIIPKKECSGAGVKGSDYQPGVWGSNPTQHQWIFVCFCASPSGSEPTLNCRSTVALAKSAR